MISTVRSGVTAHRKKQRNRLLLEIRRRTWRRRTPYQDDLPTGHSFFCRGSDGIVEARPPSFFLKVSFERLTSWHAPQKQGTRNGLEPSSRRFEKLTKTGVMPSTPVVGHLKTSGCRLRTSIVDMAIKRQSVAAVPAYKGRPRRMETGAFSLLTAVAGAPGSVSGLHLTRWSWLGKRAQRSRFAWGQTP